MKKVLTVLLAGVLMTGTLVGCGDKNESSETQEAVSPVVGKWKLVGEGFEKAKKEMGDYKLEEANYVIDSSGKCTGQAVFSFYGDVILTKEKLTMNDKNFKVDYDGKTISLLNDKNEKTPAFERIGEEDKSNIYGSYKVIYEALEKKFIPGSIWVFESEKASHWEYNLDYTYEYKEDEKKLIIKSEKKDDVNTIEFKDNNNKMVLSDSDGDVEEYERVK